MFLLKISMYDHTLHFLQSVSTKDICKCHIKDCFKINYKETIIMPKKANNLNSKIMKEK